MPSEFDEYLKNANFTSEEQEAMGQIQPEESKLETETPSFEEVSTQGQEAGIEQGRDYSDQSPSDMKPERASNDFSEGEQGAMSQIQGQEVDQVGAPTPTPGQEISVEPGQLDSDIAERIESTQEGVGNNHETSQEGQQAEAGKEDVGSEQSSLPEASQDEGEKSSLSDRYPSQEQQPQKAAPEVSKEQEDIER